jgi:hypothetical protein
MDFPDAPDQAERDRMVIRFVESKDYKDNEFCKGIVDLIRDGYVVYYPPKFFATKQGERAAPFLN